MKTTLNEADLAPVMSTLSDANRIFAGRFPGVAMARQPVHTVYGGAHLYKPGAAARLSRLAQRSLSNYAPDYVAFATALGIKGYETRERFATDADTQIARLLYERVSAKLDAEAVEDHRVDFEDGYGARPDAEEDQHALEAAGAMAEGLAAGTLPAQVGLRIKALTEEARVRALRTLDVFITALLSAGQGLPARFVVTLPKVTSEAQVAVLADCLDMLEERNGVGPGHIKIELMIETVQSLLTEGGEVRIPALVAAGRGRVNCAILGTFDYTASCNIASNYQDHMHPAADFARHIMQICLTGTAVTLCDGITNVMPIGPHRAAGEESLSAAQLEENRQVVHAAWRIHFMNVMHSLKLGFYQGWDLNPAQIPARFAAVYYFFLTGLDEATDRLKTFIDRAAQASLVGNTFDDAATGQGLVNFFVSGMNCGALTEEEVGRAGITLDELKGRSFQRIVENRTTES